VSMPQPLGTREHRGWFCSITSVLRIRCGSVRAHPLPTLSSLTGAVRPFAAIPPTRSQRDRARREWRRHS